MAGVGARRLQGDEPCRDLRTCDAKGWYQENCAKLGLQCVKDKTSGNPVCHGCSQSWWDSSCHFGWRKTCVDDALKWETCSEVCNVQP